MSIMSTYLIDENVDIDEDVQEVLEAIEAPEKFVYDDNPDEFFGNFTDEVSHKCYYDEEANYSAEDSDNQCNIQSALESLKYKESVKVHLTRESRLSEFIMRKNTTSLKQKTSRNAKVYSLEEIDSILDDINESS